MLRFPRVTWATWKKSFLFFIMTYVTLHLGIQILFFSVPFFHATIKNSGEYAVLASFQIHHFNIFICYNCLIRRGSFCITLMKLKSMKCGFSAFKWSYFYRNTMRNGEIVEVTVHEIKGAQTVSEIVLFFFFSLKLMFWGPRLGLLANRVDALSFFFFSKFIDFWKTCP